MTIAMAMVGWDECFDIDILVLSFISPEVKGFRRCCWYRMLSNLMTNRVYKFETLGTKNDDNRAVNSTCTYVNYIKSRSCEC